MKSNAESMKLDAIHQYGRRQSFQFKGVPVTENEDIELIVKISNLVSAHVTKNDISTASQTLRKDQ